MPSADEEVMNRQGFEPVCARIRLRPATVVIRRRLSMTTMRNTVDNSLSLFGKRRRHNGCFPRRSAGQDACVARSEAEPIAWLQVRDENRCATRAINAIDAARALAAVVVQVR